MSMRKRRLPLAVAYCITIAGLFISVLWGSHAVSVMARDLPVHRSRCIILDAGHGGEDGGAISCTGRLESGINLEITLRLRDLIHLLGYRTKVIRDTDISVYTSGKTIAQKKVSDLKHRVKLVNETENAVLLSIHQNNFPDSRYSGAQVFYAGTPGSEPLGRKLQESFAASLNPGSTRGVKKSSGIYLMEHVRCTAVLIECGFLSNPTEEAKLTSPDYQKKLCCVIAATLGVFFAQSNQ